MHPHMHRITNTHSKRRSEFFSMTQKTGHETNPLQYVFGNIDFESDHNGSEHILRTAEELFDNRSFLEGGGDFSTSLLDNCSLINSAARKFRAQLMCNGIPSFLADPNFLASVSPTC
ncbi:hypothetical protein CEXT_421361 [Caerostris extrusa]|uniref:Uncharacterized protein n=1 Tax=Caerostris extrusa TaxID=172846 RepID=A0AAV4W4Q9_CAEEX|nr:hypothetical protein CEXT_421361 [Caerostris extrusa]